MPYHLSIIIPILNDARPLERLLAELMPMLDQRTEVLVVDGGSSDDSLRVAGEMGCRVLSSVRGRGRQLNCGAREARGQWLWMLHADSAVVPAALDFLLSRRSPDWGRFDVAFNPPRPGMRTIARFMNQRSRLTGICTGDQGIFVHRSLLAAVHGVPEQSLMEDVELSRRLKRIARPLCPDIRLETAPRRWERDGVLRTVLAMWGWRLRYWWGGDPEVLARAYYR